MNAYEFTDFLLEQYALKKKIEISASQSVNLKDYAFGGFSENQLKSPLAKKIAARILHEFMLRIMGLKDLDWGDASAFRDIYDCRVCANSVAQVYRRGLLDGRTSDVFGMEDEIKGDILSTISEKLLTIQ